MQHPLFFVCIWFFKKSCEAGNGAGDEIVRVKGNMRHSVCDELLHWGHVGHLAFVFEIFKALKTF